jgi:hypothetical protein
MFISEFKMLEEYKHKFYIQNTIVYIDFWPNEETNKFVLKF